MPGLMNAETSGPTASRTVREPADAGVDERRDQRSDRQQEPDQVAVVREQPRQRTVEGNERHAATEAEHDRKK